MATEEGIPQPTATEFAPELKDEWRDPKPQYEQTVEIAGYAAASGPPRFRKRKLKDQGLLGTLCSVILQHQIGLSINLLLLLSLTHILFPRARQRTRKFFELSYHDAATGDYTQGWDDLAFVFFWIVVFTGLRAAAIDYVLVPLAEAWGVQQKRSKIRFAEQAWLLLYYVHFWTLGTYLAYHSDYWFNPREMWTNFPTLHMSGLMKFYYLVQFAFWLQQILVINIEARRKDHWQMFTHHIITSALIFMSYGYYQTKVGNVVLCLMDVVDLIFPLAKMLKYMGKQALCDVAFGLFIVTWFIARHVFYLGVCWSIHKDVPEVMPRGCYHISGSKLSPASAEYPADGGSDILRNVLNAYRANDDVVCFNERIRWAFLGLLLALQVITVIWFGMIMRVAYRVLKGQGADDSRSDDEGEEEEEEEDREEDAVTGHAHVKHAPLEEEVGVEQLSFARRTSPGVGRGYKRASSRTTAISIPGHGDRKELLGRIGCDKPT